MYQPERNLRDPGTECGCPLKCPRTHVVSGFEAIFAKKSCLGQCTRGFAGFLGKILTKKKPRVARVWFWRFGATAPLGLKWGLFGYTFPFEGN